jgi:hypothetical protein
MLAVSFFRIHEGKSKGLQGLKFSQLIEKTCLTRFGFINLMIQGVNSSGFCCNSD